MRIIPFNILCSILCIWGTLIHSAIDDSFIVSLEPCWHCLDDSNTSCIQFGGKWVLIGNITFKKKSLKDSIYLHQLTLTWDGPTIDMLSASLYKKNFDPTKKEFLPIDDYLVCDGIWNKTKQILILPFHDKQTLGALEVFYLVLTIPDSLEPVLKQGTFSLEKADLPIPFANTYHTQSLKLSFNTRKN